MKSLLKPAFLGTALTTLGLCCTISYAAALKPMKSFDEQQFKSNQVFTVKVVHKTSMPKLADTKNLLVANVLNKPLLSLTVNEQPELKAISPIKKNEFFEVAAIFNDKLQQFISYFDSTHGGSTDGKRYVIQQDANKTCRKSKI